MVTGIDSFKEWFEEFEGQYVIIGGTACDILMTEEGMDFRATKDIDLSFNNTCFKLSAFIQVNGINFY